MSISSWFHLFTFNLIKKMICDVNDRLKLTLQEEKRLLMVEEWDEDVQSNKEDPYGCIDCIQILKINTNQTTNEEHPMKNSVEVDYGRNSVAPQPRFSFLSSSSLQISLNPFNIWKPNPFFIPHHAYL